MTDGIRDPIEIAPDIPHAEREKAMIQWWTESSQEFIKEKISKLAVKKAVAFYIEKKRICFRSNTLKMFEMLQNIGIPILIFSAGLTGKRAIISSVICSLII
jgi:hypothetical protein